MEGLLTNNIFFVYLLGILVIINYEAFEKKQKIAIIYACSFGLTFNSNLRCTIILVLLLFVLFLYEEYLDEDLVRIKYVTKIKYKCLDFVYMYVVHYKLLYIISAIILKSSLCCAFFEKILRKSTVLAASLENVLLVISILLLIVGVHKIFNNPVELKNFKQINQKFSEYPYYLLPLKDEERRGILLEKLELVADIEDYTFFKRKNSYCSFSIEFIKAVFNKKKAEKENVKAKNSYLICKIWRKATLFFVMENFRLFVKNKHKIKKIMKYIRRLYERICIDYMQILCHFI